jgi:hypothetical protein
MGRFACYAKRRHSSPLGRQSSLPSWTDGESHKLDYEHHEPKASKQLLAPIWSCPEPARESLLALPEHGSRFVRRPHGGPYKPGRLGDPPGQLAAELHQQSSTGAMR